MVWLMILLGWLTIAIVLSPVCGRLLASRAACVDTAPETSSASDLAQR